MMFLIAHNGVCMLMLQSSQAYGIPRNKLSLAITIATLNEFRKNLHRPQTKGKAHNY